MIKRELYCNKHSLHRRNWVGNSCQGMFCTPLPCSVIWRKVQSAIEVSNHLLRISASICIEAITLSERERIIPVWGRELLVFCCTGPWRPEWRCRGTGKGAAASQCSLLWCDWSGKTGISSMHSAAWISHKREAATIYITILPEAWHCDSSCGLPTTGPSSRVRKERFLKLLWAKFFLDSAHRSSICPKA